MSVITASENKPIYKTNEFSTSILCLSGIKYLYACTGIFLITIEYRYEFKYKYRKNNYLELIDQHYFCK